LDELLCKDGEGVKFCVGPHTSRKNSGWNFSFENRKNIRDRFLSISIDHQKISISNDHIGSIPVCYSLRKSISISNIEPVVVLDSDSSYEDLSPEAVYGLFRYTHLIETETFYRHIRTQEPDSTCVYTKETQEPAVKYNETITPSEERFEMKNSDVIAELFEINRKLVQETLSDAEDIILPLSSGYDSRMILAAAVGDKDIKSRLRCYTYAPNMSLESRPAKELCKISGVNWKKVQLPVDSFNMRRLEQTLGIFGSWLHVHGKYQLDFIDQIKHTFSPGQSVIASGFMTGVATGSSFVCDLNINSNEPVLTDAMDMFGVSKYITDDYLFAHSRELHHGMKCKVESGFRKSFDRFNGLANQKMIMFDVWARQRNFYSYQPSVMEWEIPYIGPHVAPEFLNFTLSLPPQMLRQRKGVEMMLSKYYPAISRVSSNSNLTVRNISKRSIARPREGILHYAPLLVKYFFKQPWLLPVSYIAEMKTPSTPDLRNIGKDGVFPLFDLNAESREIFDGYFDLNEVNNLFSLAMTGDELSSKRLTILETLAYALKMLEK
ncbi:MAG: hypothetical protein KAS17_09525, partial [Victivallaceae bacterium]|nr:hypothetical protein [Victivallaceae bacterium]